MICEVAIRGIIFQVEYEHEPGEKPVRYYPDGTGYPGSSDKYEIVDITFKGTSFYDFFENELDKVKELLICTIDED